MQSLRNYQIDLISTTRELLAEHRRVLVVLPTGGGKTQTFCSIAQLSTHRNNNVLVLAHRVELIEQISYRLQQMQVPHGILAPGHPITHAQVQVASIQAAARRLSSMPWSPNLILVDEAHHCAARSWQQILAGYPNAHIIGWTATPQRLDGKGLVDSFDALAEGPSVARLIETGYLSKYRLFAPPTGADLTGLAKRGGDYRTEDTTQRMSEPKVLYAAVQNYLKFAAGRRAVAFCTSVRHAELVLDAFRAAGVPSDLIEGTLAPADRANRLEGFRSGQISVLVSVDLISEGFDVPACDCAILLRPTASLALYLQQVGRALRPSDKEAIILDCAGNSALHGLPCDVREWSLQGIAPKSRTELQSVPIRVCPSCYGVHRPAPACPFCGHTHVVGREPPREVQKELVEVDPAAAAREKKAKRSEVGSARTLEQLLEVAKSRGYRPGWAHAVMKSRKSK
jgi:DNA repair protein RadD